LLFHIDSGPQPMLQNDQYLDCKFLRVPFLPSLLLQVKVTPARTTKKQMKDEATLTCRGIKLGRWNCWFVDWFLNIDLFGPQDTEHFLPREGTVADEGQGSFWTEALLLWWCTPVILALGRQDNHEFQTSPGKVRESLSQKQKYKHKG
jgi:hypothetical protein